MARISSGLTGQELALSALKKEHKRLLKAAARAKEEFDEYINVYREMAKARKELADIYNSKIPAKEALPKVEELERRNEKHTRIIKKDGLKLSDKQLDKEFAAEALAREIQDLEFRLHMRKRL